MVPKVAGKGKSFKGAGLYYLHDKKAATADRVVFTQTHNLATDNPDFAIRMMAYTAMHQAELKAAGGAAATGRKLVHAVYSYSLSWAPDETPTQEQMLEAAHETLEALGLSDHEALLVAHNDEPHPHIHVIVNRVHPETGLAAKLACDHLILSRWAEGYERRQGQIRCEERVKNNERRRKGQFVKDRASLGPGNFRNWRRNRIAAAVAARQAAANKLAARHAAQRQTFLDPRPGLRPTLYENKERRIRQLRSHLRERNRPKWAELYRRHREEKKALNEAQKTAYGRLRHHLRSRGDDPRNRHATGRRAMIADAVRAVFGRDNPHGALARKQEVERRALATATRRELREGVSEINKHYRQDVAQLKQAQGPDEKLKQAQAAERYALQREHSRQSQQLARDIKTGRDKDQFRAEAGKTAKDDFNERVRQRIKKNKARDQRKRGKDKDEGRER